MLQNTVNLYPSIGFAGQQVAFNQAVYTPENFVSDGTCQAGRFAFLKEVESTGSAVVFGTASLTGEAGSKVLGLVERNVIGSMPLTNDPVVMNTYAEGEQITIALRGDYYIEAPATATVGQSVLCDPTTGEITFGTAGATNDTGWVVKSAGEEGDMIIISNHGLDVAPSAA